MNDLFWALIDVSLILFLYFFPLVVAILRGHHQRTAIGVLTFLTAWTCVGWIAALVWACTAVRPAYTQPRAAP